MCWCNQTIKLERAQEINYWSLKFKYKNEYLEDRQSIQDNRFKKLLFTHTERERSLEADVFKTLVGI